MLSLLSTLLVFRVISAVTALGLPHMARAADSTFNLYAYGDGIGGIPLLYSNGNQENNLIHVRILTVH